MSEPTAAALARIRKFADGGTINGTYSMMPIAALTAFRGELLDLLDAFRTRQPADTAAVERVALIKKMLEETPSYAGDDSRAVFYRKRRDALAAAIAAMSPEEKL